MFIFVSLFTYLKLVIILWLINADDIIISLLDVFIIHIYTQSVHFSATYVTAFVYVRTSMLRTSTACLKNESYCLVRNITLYILWCAIPTLLVSSNLWRKYIVISSSQWRICSSLHLYIKLSDYHFSYITRSIFSISDYAISTNLDKLYLRCHLSVRSYIYIEYITGNLVHHCTKLSTLYNTPLICTYVLDICIFSIIMLAYKASVNLKIFNFKITHLCC